MRPGGSHQQLQSAGPSRGEGAFRGGGRFFLARAACALPLGFIIPLVCCPRPPTPNRQCLVLWRSHKAALLARQLVGRPRSTCQLLCSCGSRLAQREPSDIDGCVIERALCRCFFFNMAVTSRPRCDGEMKANERRPKQMMTRDADVCTSGLKSLDRKKQAGMTKLSE